MKRENKNSAICQVCKKEMKMSELMPAVSVRNSMIDLITKDTGSWDPNGYICLQDLNKYRGNYVQKVLEEENGKLSTFDKEVLDSILERDLISKNVDSDLEQNITLGDKLSDKLAKFGGSWRFILIFGFFLLLWMAVNIFLMTVHPFDPYPFILLNLILSCLAAIQAPIIMMSQNRQESKDRARSVHDYQVNLKAELEIKQLNDKVDHLLMQQGQKMLEIQQIQLELMEEISERMKKG